MPASCQTSSAATGARWNRSRYKRTPSRSSSRQPISRLHPTWSPPRSRRRQCGTRSPPSNASSAPIPAPSRSCGAVQVRFCRRSRGGSKTSVELTRKQQELGYVNYLALLTAEQAYQQTAIALVQAQATRFGDTAGLFQALGGGWWNRPADVAEAEAETKSSN